MIHWHLLDDPIPLPKLDRDSMGAFFVAGCSDPRPREVCSPDGSGWPDVTDHFAGRKPYDYDQKPWVD